MTAEEAINVIESANDARALKAALKEAILTIDKGMKRDIQMVDDLRELGEHLVDRLDSNGLDILFKVLDKFATR